MMKSEEIKKLAKKIVGELESDIYGLELKRLTTDINTPFNRREQLLDASLTMMMNCKENFNPAPGVCDCVFSSGPHCILLDGPPLDWDIPWERLRQKDKVEKERDAAVKDIETLCDYFGCSTVCDICGTDERKCPQCLYNEEAKEAKESLWTWRGTPAR